MARGKKTAKPVDNNAEFFTALKLMEEERGIPQQFIAEKIADAISKNSTKDEKIEAIKKLGYKRSVARRIYTLYNDAE